MGIKLKQTRMDGMRETPTAYQIQTLERFLQPKEAQLAFKDVSWAWGADGLTIYAICIDGMVEIKDNQLLNLN